MSSRRLASTDGRERTRAIRRLREAVAEQRRAKRAPETADGKPNDVDSLRGAGVEVPARERWLESV